MQNQAERARQAKIVEMARVLNSGKSADLDNCESCLAKLTAGDFGEWTDQELKFAIVVARGARKHWQGQI